MAEINHLHQREQEDFDRLIKDQPPEKQKLLRRVFEVFIRKEGHISVEDLKKALEEEGLSLPLSEIEKALELFCCLGLACRKEFLGQKPLFEHRHLGQHHDHLVCTKCGRIQEFYVPGLEKLQEEIARTYGFKPLDHRLEIYGLCEACQKARGRPTLPLVLISAGEKVRVERFLGGSKMQNRLAGMGLTLGQEIEVLNNCGPVIVSVRGSRLALGHGLASKILVTPVD